MRRRFPLVAMGLAAFAAASFHEGTARAARPCETWSGNGGGVFSLVNALDDAYASHVDEAGLGGLRFGFRIDTQTTWNKALFDQYDALVTTAAAHGIDLTAIVLYESTTLDQTQWNSGYDSTGASPYVQTFVDTAKLLMQRYGDRVKHWEIWNEPNAYTNAGYMADPAHAGGTYILPQVYSKLLAETFIQANAVITAQKLHLVAGGLFAHDIGGGFSPATDYMKQVYDLGPWDYMQANYGRRYPWDAFGYHIYVDQGGATTAQHLSQYLDAVATLKTQYADATPIWITEFGWQAPSVVSEAQQAANIDLALTTFEARSDVERAFVFKVDDYDDWGIFRGDFSKKPAAQTMIAHDTGCTHLPKVIVDAGADASADAGANAGAGANAKADADANGDADANADADTNAGAHADGGACSVGSGAGSSSLLASLAMLLFAARRRRR